ncbi:MAG: AAA family ATPase [Polyangiaceae bacterium]|nr:AAA family ATPase [Polyangiaceae bacterium]
MTEPRLPPNGHSDDPELSVMIAEYQRQASGEQTPAPLEEDCATDVHIPPHDLDAEGSVLSSVLLSAEAFDAVQEVLKAEHFYSDANRRVYEAVVDLQGSGRPVDLVAVAGWLRDRGRLQQVGGTAYLVQLTDATPAVVNVNQHAERIVEMWARRRVHELCSLTAIQARQAERPTVELVQELTESLGRITEPGSTGLEIIEADAIFEAVPPTPWLIRGLDLCPGAPAMLAGYGFGGKSIAAQAMALDTAAECRIWGAFEAASGRVIHLDYEQGEHLTRRRYHRLLHGADLTPEDVRGRLGLVCHPATYLDDSGADAMLLRLLDGVTLCIVDSLRAASPKLEENSSEARRVLDMLGRVSERTGCTILVIHHARKAAQNAVGGVRETIRGSGALYDACGSVLVVEGSPEEETRTIHHVKARVSGKCADPMLLRIDDTDGGGLVVSVEEAPSQEEREHDRRIARDDRFDAVVLAEVTKGPGRSTTELASALHANRSRDVSPALTRLRMVGQIRREEGPRRSELWWPTGKEVSS